MVLEPYFSVLKHNKKYNSAHDICMKTNERQKWIYKP